MSDRDELVTLILGHGPEQFSGPAAACRCGEARHWDTWTTYTRHLADVLIAAGWTKGDS